jgi:hypothetical protein
MSISQNFGNVSPSLLLDFANTKQLDSRVTFTRSTPAVYYDGKTTAMAEQNLITYSQALSAWSNGGVVITENNTTAPDGTATADKVAGTATNNYHQAYNSFVVTFGVTYTTSIYMKAAEYTKVFVSDGSAGRFSALVDLTAVTISNVTSFSSTSITSVGNGWYRFVGTVNANVSGDAAFAVVGVPDTGTSFNAYGAIFTGDGTSGAYFWGAQAEQRATATAYTPTTTQPITNYIPVLLSAGGNQARFDCNPTTGESLGLLIEEQRTNNVLNSQNFNNWTKYNCTVNNAAIISPSGSLDGNKLISSATTNVQTVESSNATFVSGSIYTLSVYAKAGEYRYIQMSLPSFVTAQYVNADLVSGTINGGSYVSASITSVGNSWYRISFSFTSSYSGATVAAGISLQTTVNPSRSTNITGDGFSGLYIWGAQLEAGSFATSYIATTSASATRTADVAVMTGTNFSNWFNASEGSVYYELSTSRITTDCFCFNFDNGTASSNSNFIYSSSVSSRNLFVSSLGSTEVNLGAGVTVSSNTFFKTALGYKNNDFGVSVNGSVTTTDTIGVVPLGLARLVLGTAYDLANANYINGCIRKFTYYPIKVTSTNLQSLTS